LLSPISDFYIQSSARLAGIICISASTFAMVTTEPVLYQKTYTNTPINSVALSGNPAGIALYAAGSAVINYSGTSKFDFVDLTTTYIATTSTNANPALTAFNAQQISANIITGYAVATHSTTGRYHIINCLTRSASSFTPSFLTGQAVNVVNTKDNNFILGTSLGNVYEVDQAGNLISGYQLPRTKNNGITPLSYPVLSLVYAPSSVIVTTGRGTGYVLSLSASSISSEFLCQEADFPSVSTSACLSNVSSGAVVLGSPAMLGYTQGIQEYALGSSAFSALDSTFMECNMAIKDIKIDPSGTLALIGTQDVNNLTFKVRSCNITPSSQVTVKTRAQYPVGVDITGTIIRIKDRGVGMSAIEVDQAITAGDNYPLACSNNDYIEVCLNGLTGPSELWDVREFTA
jgi:hypothetical protein